jgi:alkylhydroperoxidase family enzyme
MNRGHAVRSGLTAHKERTVTEPFTKTVPRLPAVDRDTITDPEFLAVLERSERLSTPKPAWFLTLGHAPDVAIAFDAYWDTTFRQGCVEHSTKEMVRLTIVTMLGCDFCGSQRSMLALEEMTAEELEACALPGFDHPDPRVRAALRFARAIAHDTSSDVETDWDAVYGELREHYDDAEVAELLAFTTMALGGVLIARTLDLD